MSNIILENDKLQVQINENDGSLINISNKDVNADAVNNIDETENFRLSIPLEDDWTNMVIGKEHPAQIKKKGANSLEIIWENIEVDGSPRNIKLKAQLWLENDELKSKMNIENNSKYSIDYVWYPVLGGITKLMPDKNDDLYRPSWSGDIERNIYAREWPAYRNRYWYNSREFKLYTYPVDELMQWLSLANDSSGLYFCSQDNEKFYTMFFLEHERKNTPMKFSIVKAPFMKSQEQWQSPVNIISFYKGSWHTGALKYKNWIETWFSPKDSPEWVEQMDGWLAFQGHAGDMHIEVPYEKYPEWLEKARAVGLNTIHIHCGVHEEGIEGGFPYWSNWSKRMGGREKLVEVIDEINDKGGRVVTFTKENKVNMGLPEYDDKFKKYAIKLRDGSSPRVNYEVGTPDMLLGKAQLAGMCRACEEWHDFIVPEMEEIAQTGIDGNMIDEWCSCRDLCMSEEHGHEKPVDQFVGQLDLGRKISEASLKHNEDYLLAGEEIWDASFEFMDVSFARGRSYSHYEVLKMAFPWMKRTAEITENDYDHLNHAFACGMIFALCFDYYHSGPEAYPEFASYLKEVIRIRKEVRPFFVNGKFEDVRNTDVKIESGNIDYRSFVMDKRKLICIYNRGDKNTAVQYNPDSSIITLTVREPGKENKTLNDVDSYSHILSSKRLIVLECEGV